MSETPASEEPFDLKRENLADDSSSSADVGASSLTASEEAQAALTVPLLVTPGGGEQATDKQRNPRRGGSIGAMVAAALIVSLMSYALLHLAPLASGAHKANALTADSSATLTPTNTATVSATATAAPTATRVSNVASRGTPDNFTVQSISSIFISADTDGGTGMTASSNTSGANFTGGCGPHIFYSLDFTLTLSALPKTGMTIDYYVRSSDGTSDGSLSQPVEPTWGSPATTNTLTTGSHWSIPYTQVTGAPQWVELDILRPNPLTERMDFTTSCPFTPGFPQVSASPTRYDCTTGGSQSFTVTGALTATLTSDPGSHTLTYHWQRADGNVTPDQTVTFAPGATSMAIPSDTSSITFQTSAVGPDNSYSIDKLIVTDGNGHTTANDAIIRSTC